VYDSLSASPEGSLLARPRPAKRRAQRPSGAPQRPSGTRIAAIAVSDAERALSQEQVLERLGLTGDEFAEGIFARCGVQRRQLDLEEDFLAATLQARTARIEQTLLEHSVRAVDALAVDPLKVGTVVSATLYSLGCPTLAHRLVEHYAMAPTTDKYHLTGVACASGVPLMRLTAKALRDHPGRDALIVAAESMSGLMSAAAPDDPRAKVVGAAIFGDGCAAAVLSDDPHAEGPAILDSRVHQIADTLDVVRMGSAGEHAYLHLDRELPYLVGAALGEVADGFLAANDLDRSAIDHWIVHPGGRRIVENVQSALGLSREDVAVSWDALADHGNVGTPSIFYVLKDTIERRRPAPGEHGLIVTIGPGVTVGLMLLGW
jgi:predicted naringenin-chalcone synthase